MSWRVAVFALLVAAAAFSGGTFFDSSIRSLISYPADRDGRYFASEIVRAAVLARLKAPAVAEFGHVVTAPGTKPGMFTALGEVDGVNPFGVPIRSAFFGQVVRVCEADKAACYVLDNLSIDFETVYSRGD